MSLAPKCIYSLFREEETEMQASQAAYPRSQWWRQENLQVLNL